jgi:ABC-2 type transport system ATP-binding protein
MDDKNIIEVKNLVRKFGDIVAVDGVSFNVKEGEIFAFLGPNGAGKTTTIKMLTTLLRPTSGKIKVNNFSPVSEQNEVRKSIGIVFQDPSLDEELTAYENMEFHGVLYGVKKEVREKKIKELLKLMDLTNRKNSFVKTFSGGMKRRLEIARGFLHSPKILFLDEPTLGLDAQTRSYMWEYVLKLAKEEKMTIFMTTHYLEEAEKVAERIAIIDNGKIKQIGSSEKLKKSTKSKSLEEAYLKITGHKIREEKASVSEMMKKKFGGRR